MKCEKDGCPEQATRRGKLRDGSPWDPPTVIDLCDGHAVVYERKRLLLEQFCYYADRSEVFYTEAL